MLAFPPDITFVIQIVSFFILLAGLHKLMFEPTLKVLKDREARTSGLLKEAAKVRSTAESAGQEYERRITEGRAGIARTSESDRAATDEDERRILAEAREAAAASLAVQRQEITKESEELRKALGGELESMSDLLLERVVGRRMS